MTTLKASTPSQSSSTPCVKPLPLENDLLCHIFQYLDYETTRLFLDVPGLKLWKQFFSSAGFSGAQISDYYAEYPRRKKLLENLFQSVVVIPDTGWNNMAVPNPLRDLKVTFLARHTLVRSVDYFRRHRTNHNSVFSFVLASTSVQKSLVVLERDNQNQVTASLVERSGYCLRKHILFDGNNDTGHTNIRLLDVKYREDIHMVGLVLASELETNVYIWSYDLPRVNHTFAFRILGPCQCVDYSINDSLEPVLHVVQSNQLKLFGLNQTIPRLLMSNKEKIAAMGLCTLSSTSVLVRKGVPWMQGSIQVNHPGGTGEIVPIHEALDKAFEDSKRDLSFLCSTVLFVRGTEAGPTIESHVFIPRHLPLTQFGFVTLHTSRETFRTMTSGNHTLLLWEPQTNGKYPWVIYAMVNLPLLPNKTPQVHFDGNRLIVFGQDHIGKILLIYQVHKRAPQTEAPARESSGGVYNFIEQRVQFRNRIRHEALETDENLQMSCNERYITVRTKRGSLVDGSSEGGGDGVLVFDCGQDE